MHLVMMVHSMRMTVLTCTWMREMEEWKIMNDTQTNEATDVWAEEDSCRHEGIGRDVMEDTSMDDV